MAAPEWCHREVEEPESHLLTVDQQRRVLKAMETLREVGNLVQIGEIKLALMHPDKAEGLAQARVLWGEFTDEEQMAIWIAPRYGGVFTTAERKLLKEGA